MEWKGLRLFPRKKTGCRFKKSSSKPSPTGGSNTGYKAGIFIRENPYTILSYNTYKKGVLSNLAVLSGWNPDDALKGFGEVALVGKTDRMGNFGG